MKITEFVKVESQEKKLERVRRASSKEEKRKIEENLLLPDELPPYTKEEPSISSEVDGKSVLFVFGSEDDVELLSKHFRISNYKGKNIRSSNLNMMVDFLTALENKEIVYDKDRRKFKYNQTQQSIKKLSRNK